MLVDFILGDEAFLRWQLCQIAGVFPPGKGVFFQWTNQFVGVVYLKTHHALVSVAGIPEDIDLVHDRLVGLRVRQQIHELFRFFRETTPERANDAHIPRLYSFLAYITGHIQKLLRKLPLLEGPALCQLHIGSKLPLLQQLTNSVGNILPRDDLGIGGIPGGAAIGQAYTVLGIPCAYLLTIELQAIAAMVGLFQENYQIVLRLLLGVFNGDPYPVVLCVAAIAEELVNILLGHGKSGGCNSCTLRLGNVCNLLGFRGEEGKLLSLDGNLICQA